MNRNAISVRTLIRAARSGADLNQAHRIRRAGPSERVGPTRESAAVSTVKWIITSTPEIFLLLSVAIGTILGRVKFKGFALGTTACILIVAVILGQFGTFVIPPLFKSIFFSLFVFTIGYRSGPEFFASLSLRTLSQAGVAIFVSATGLLVVLGFAFLFHLEAGTAAGLAAGGLTQSSLIGTATGALAQLGARSASKRAPLRLRSAAPAAH
jgi:putative transport protein